MNRCPDCGWPMEGKTCLHCKFADYDANDFRKYNDRSILDKTMNTFEGVLTGISIDNEMGSKEIEALLQWCIDNQMLANKKPYDELFNHVFSAIEDNVLTEDEKEDLIWLCRRLRGDGIYYDCLTHDMQVLHGILYGILADGKITKEELTGLDDWLYENEQLASYYPYDEICTLVNQVLKDGVVSPEEEQLLKAFFSQFTNSGAKCGYCSEKEKTLLTTAGICVLDPEITISDHLFCFTGKSEKASRSELAEIIVEHGGKFSDGVTAKTDYLIIGNAGNQCWAFSCYGRKVEKAIDLRKKGNHILIVNELDFWDSLI